jgi:hypothetical protein
LVAKIAVTGEHKELFDKFPEPDKAGFRRKLVLEAAKAKIAFEADATFEILTIEKRMPITGELSEANLIDGIGEMNFAALVLIGTIGLELQGRAA